MRFAAKVVFALIFLAIVVGAVWLAVLRMWGSAAICIAIATLFGVFVVRDVREATKKS